MNAPPDKFQISSPSSARRLSGEEMLADFDRMSESMLTPAVVGSHSNVIPTELERHPIALALALPRGEHFDALLTDIRETGPRVPIVIYEGKILDGGDRYDACRQLGLTPIFEEYKGSDPRAEFFRLNVLRRHLPKAQLAAIVFRNTNPESQAKHGGRRDQAATLPLATVRSQALLAGCSEKTQREVNRIGRASPEAARRMAEEGLTIAAARAIALPVEVVTRESKDSPSQLIELRIALRTSAMAALNNAHPASARMPDDTWALYLSQLGEYERELSGLQVVISLLKAQLLEHEAAAVTNERIRREVDHQNVKAEAAPVKASRGAA